MTDWIEWTWTEEKPYPETLDTLIFVRYGCGKEDDIAYKVGQAIHKETNLFEPYDIKELMITHYKLAEPDND